MTIDLSNELVEECVSLFKDGAGKMDVARHISENTDFKLTAARKRGNVIWEKYIGTEYVPVQQRYVDDFDEDTPKGDRPPSGCAESVKFEQISADKGVAVSRSKIITTLDGLLESCKVDMDVWYVKRHVVNKWDVSMKMGTGESERTETIQNFQVKAWLERNETSKAKEVIELFKNELGKIRGPVQKRNSGGKYLYEISIPDLHLSKMAWAKETGHGDYDIKIAADLYRQAVADLISRVDLDTVEKVLLPVGNDFFNSEGLTGMTTAGTRQDDDSRWPKSFQVGCSLITDVITELSKKVNVDVVIVAGNHDYERDFYLGEYLKAWYRENEAVAIDNAPTNRKYVKFGSNLIMFTHGNEEKQADLPLLMATECKYFSECKYRTAHLGHLHQDWLREYKGVKVRVLPSLCPPDAWHAKKGYVGNTQSAMGFLYCPKYGEISNFYFNVV